MFSAVTKLSVCLNLRIKLRERLGERLNKLNLVYVPVLLAHFL